MTLIAHVTTVHHRGDTRICVKQVASLARGLKVPVALVVQDGEGSENSRTGPQIIDSGARPKRRLLRMTLGSWRMWRKLRQIRPDVIHFHDPELIFLGLAMRFCGTKVIYDVHEDVPRQILTKDWIPALMRPPVAAAVEVVESVSCRVFDAIVPATPRIAARFPRHKTTLVQNFPIPEELLSPQPVPYEKRHERVAYIGDISLARAAYEMVLAMSLLPAGSEWQLDLAGGFSDPALQPELEALPGWERVRYHGWAKRPQVAEILGSVRAGLVLLHPDPNCIEAYPNKMFEYMAAGLPVVASDFPLWREIVADTGAGLLVDPQDPAAIAGAIAWLLEHPVEAEAMGQRGRRAVEQKFNWGREEKKLLRLYEWLLAEVQPVDLAGEIS